ncbi:hypothetical protein [Burkholderia ubonensis]|uniref:hypothetical protein n=1 Tax=Burkholderia ubonensis TaxID=101571 RepID=UPI0012FC96F6|nr:hypothetical protein [Burkholderia ubonensis]
MRSEQRPEATGKNQECEHRAAELGPRAPAVTSNAKTTKKTATADNIVASILGEAFDTSEASIIVTAVPDCLPELPSCLHRS